MSEKADPKSEDKENVVVVVAESDDVPDKIRDPDASCLIKSVPEPTRVKSPEQLVVRSPDPVNWTVPLDTGKTFTVTQNIRGGQSDQCHPFRRLIQSCSQRNDDFNSANESRMNEISLSDDQH